MAKYRCKEQGAKVWRDAVNIGGVVDGVSLNTIVTAEKIGAALYISSGTQNGLKGWSKLGWFEIVEADPAPEPPPQPSGNRAFTLFVDGFKPFSGELERG